MYNDYSPERLGVRPTAQLANRLLTDAFIWMFLAVLLSGLVAWLVQTNEDLVLNVANLRMPLFIAQLGLGLGIQWGIRRINAGVALALFLIVYPILAAILVEPPSTASSLAARLRALAPSFSWAPGASSSPS